MIFLIFIFHIRERRLRGNPAKSLQQCPTLCDPTDGSSPGTPVPGILQARTLEWGAISFSNAWKWKVKLKSLSRVWLLATPWIAAYQAPPSMGFSRQEYWSGVPLPSPRGNPQKTHKIGRWDSRMANEAPSSRIHTSKLWSAMVLILICMDCWNKWHFSIVCACSTGRLGNLVMKHNFTEDQRG